ISGGIRQRAIGNRAVDYPEQLDMIGGQGFEKWGGSMKFKERRPIRVAEDLRMSTQHQKNSIANQHDAIHQYALAHGMVIVRSYSDSAKSGVTLNGRTALQQLLDDVESGAADYSAILVYDVSRWGRFQDVDESAYYEFRCKRARITIHYCAESFPNDG